MNKEPGEILDKPTPSPLRMPATPDIGRAPRILAPAHNCWRIAHATRAKFLIDGESYFAAFRAAAMNARRSIFIVGWDIDSRTVLTHDNPADSLPVRLGEFLEALLRRRHGLDVYILNWDFIMLYAPDRELLPAYKLGWRSGRRMHFRLDDRHPAGASHHQKIVVIDDEVAFVGGLDLSDCRWDTSAHSPHEKRRSKQNGAPYPPFHDVQLMVDDKAAIALGALVRERWRRATGVDPHKEREELAPQRYDPWPTSLAPDVTDVDVAIARTEPPYLDRQGVQETKQLYLDAIAAAQHTIYIENQYLTAHCIGEALEQRLREPNGPEIVIVSRLRGGGWLERSTMTVLRARLLKRLRAADVHGRLRVYYPDHAEMSDQCIDLHSKLMIVDERFVRVGSSNLNNRSLGLDTECDLAIEASDARTAQAIAHFRDRLLAEHLGVEPDAVARMLRRKNGSLIATVEALQGKPRGLKSLVDEIAPEMDALIPDAAIIDPEEPIDPDQLMNELIPSEPHGSGGKRIAVGALLLFLIAALAVAWRWGPLGEWINAETIAETANGIRGRPTTWLWVLGGYIVASLIAVPITVLIVATVMVFGPMLGFGYAIAGSLLGATVTFGIGQLLGHQALRRLAGAHINELSRRLGRHGVLTVMAVRLVPVAPFTVVNLVAGASAIGLRDFLIGTTLGMVPGIVALTFFSDSLVAALRDPSPLTITILVGAALAIIFVALASRAWLKRRGNPQPTAQR